MFQPCISKHYRCFHLPSGDINDKYSSLPANVVLIMISSVSLLQRSLHGSCPVIKGEKWVATKWIRDQTEF